MTKIYLSVSADEDTGEAGLTKGTKLQLETLITLNPLVAADILKDCVHDFSEFYDRAVEAMNREFAARREFAAKQGVASDD